MSFLDKLKNATNSAKETVKAAAETAKANIEQKKAEQEAYNAKMTAKAEQAAQNMVAAIEGGSAESGIFSAVSQEELLAFAKDFYDKILMPANSVSRSCITMHPYIVDKTLNKFKSSVGIFHESEQPILHIVVEKTRRSLSQTASCISCFPWRRIPIFLRKEWFLAIALEAFALRTLKTDAC